MTPFVDITLEVNKADWEPETEMLQNHFQLYEETNMKGPVKNESKQEPKM